MKRLYFLAALFFCATASQATVWIVTNSGFTFSPSVVTINLGDTVMFNLPSQHNVVEVSQATWNANQNTSNGGFSLPFGGGMVIPSAAQVYYYVCQPHASLGMKGQIIVNNPNGIQDVSSATIGLKLNPNPARTSVQVFTGIPLSQNGTLAVYDITGKLLIRKERFVSNQYLDISPLKNGIYFVEITSEDFTRTTKLVVAR